MAIAINSKELETLLEVTPSWQNIMLTGRHGIGKSQILTHYFESKGMRVVASMPPEDEDDEWVSIYAKDEADAVSQLHEQNLIPEALSDFASIKQYVDEKFGPESFEVATINEVYHPFADFM